MAVTAPALVSVASFGTLPVFVMEHISLSGKGGGPLGAGAADVAVGVLFGLAATLILGHLRVALAHAARPHLWVGSKCGAAYALSAVHSERRVTAAACGQAQVPCCLPC